MHHTNTEMQLKSLQFKEASLSLRAYFEVGYLCFGSVSSCVIHRFFQAEVDIDYAKFLTYQMEEESSIMKNRKDWQVGKSSYTGLYSKPVFGVRDNKIDEIIRKNLLDDSKKLKEKN